MRGTEQEVLSVTFVRMRASSCWKGRMNAACTHDIYVCICWCCSAEHGPDRVLDAGREDVIISLGGGPTLDVRWLLT